jgi:hypothetical protein
MSVSTVPPPSQWPNAVSHPKPEPNTPQPSHHPGAFWGIPLDPGQSRLLQEFRSAIKGGDPQYHFDLLERRNAQGKYELVMISADPNGRHLSAIVVEGGRPAAARLEEFGRGQPLVKKMGRAFAALNAPENRLSAPRPGGVNIGNLRDAAAAIINGKIALVTFPQKWLRKSEQVR